MHKKIGLLLLVLVALLTGLVLNTSPVNSPIILLTVPVILIGIIVGLVTYILSFKLAYGKFGPEIHIFFAFTSGLSMSLLVVMSSLGQLNFGTGFLLVIFVSVLVFYFRRLKK
jgi:hypothetical protein